MKCAILKRTDGFADVAMICNEKGEIISGDVEQMLDSVVSNSLGVYSSWRITEHTNLPGGSGDCYYDNFFSSAFTDDLEGEQVDIAIEKAKEIAHFHRRNDRESKMAPLDIKSTIPAFSELAESERQKIRDVNTEVQSLIDISTMPEQIKEALNLLYNK